MVDAAPMGAIFRPSRIMSIRGALIPVVVHGLDLHRVQDAQLLNAALLNKRFRTMIQALFFSSLLLLSCFLSVFSSPLYPYLCDWINPAVNFWRPPLYFVRHLYVHALQVHKLSYFFSERITDKLFHIPHIAFLGNHTSTFFGLVFAKLMWWLSCS